MQRGLIPWLAGIDPDTGSPRRRIARLSEIPPESRPLIERLIEFRLLSTDKDEKTGETTIEPSHEIFHRGRRVAAHQRRYGGPRHGTDPEHMPSAHRRYAEWSPERFRRWASNIGPNTEGLVIAVLANRPHPEQGFRTCLGILRLYRGITAARAEAVSARAIEIGALLRPQVAKR